MKNYSVLEPEVAARRELKDLWFTLETIADTARISESELLEELRSGRLIAWGTPNGKGGYSEVMVRGDQFIEWLERTGRKLGELPPLKCS